MHAGATAMLYVFEDNEAVIKMIIKGRSPTMRHVSRTTELLWDLCLTESIWTQKSKSVTLTANTNSQTSWPKGISRVMSGIIFFVCSILSALFAAPKISAWLAALRWQEEFRKGLYPSRDLQWMCLLVLLRQVPLPHQVRLHRKSPGMSGASETGSRMNLEASSFDASSPSQVRLKDAYVGGLMVEQQGNLTHEKEQISEESDDAESVPWYYKPLAQTYEACRKPVAGETPESISSAFQKSQNNKEATLEHFVAISPQTISCTEAVYDMVRKIYGRPSDDPMEDLDVHVAIWGISMNATLKPPVHPGKWPWREFETLQDNFSERQKSWSVVRQRLLV